MKKSIIGMVVAGFTMLVGCTPDENQIKETATAIGYAAGLVANETNIKDEARGAVISILNEVRSCIPGEGQTFVETWEPVIIEKVEQLIADGKLEASLGDIVASVSLLAAKGIDYLFDVRFPKAKKYAELVSAGTSGAIDGFLTTFKPANGAEARAKVDYDKEAYKWLKAHKPQVKAKAKK